MITNKVNGMDSEFEMKVAEQLGELLYKKEHCSNWIEASEIVRKLNACYTLLGIDKKEPMFWDWVKESIWKTNTNK